MTPEIMTRGNLPHWYVPGAAHFVTYRLAGTLPAEVAQRLRTKKRELLQHPLADGQTQAQRRHHVNKLLFGDYDDYLDSGQCIDWLKRAAVAAVVRRNLSSQPKEVPLARLLRHAEPCACAADSD